MTCERFSAILKGLGTCNMVGSKVFGCVVEVDDGLVLRLGEVLKIIVGLFLVARPSVIRPTATAQDSPHRPTF